MIMDSRHYLSRKDTILRLIITYEGKDMNRRLGEISVATGVPIIVVYSFYFEEFNYYTPELAASRARIMSFYGYTEVL